MSVGECEWVWVGVLVQVITIHTNGVMYGDFPLYDIINTIT